MIGVVLHRLHEAELQQPQHGPRRLERGVAAGGLAGCSAQSEQRRMKQVVSGVVINGLLRHFSVFR